MDALYTPKEIADLASALRRDVYLHRIGVVNEREVAEAALRHLVGSGWRRGPAPAAAIAPAGTPVPTTPLTGIQRQILQAIVDLTRDNGYPPSQDEIGQRVDRSRSSVCYQLKQMAASGWIGPEYGYRHPFDVLHRSEAA